MAAASLSPALLTGERLMVFLFAARVALAAPALLAAPLVILTAAALAVELAVDSTVPPPAWQLITTRRRTRLYMQQSRRGSRQRSPAGSARACHTRMEVGTAPHSASGR